MEYKSNTEASCNDNSQIAIVRQKIVCVGDIAVGKTSIINSFLESKFKDVYEVYYKKNTLIEI
jgi:GTPase SAR1 family protein